MKLPLDKIILRGEDPTGNGWYAAKRGDNLHKGLDLIATPGTKVFSMISGKVTKIGYCYKDALQFRYIEVTNAVYRIRLLYTSPDIIKKGDSITEGQLLGFVQDVAGHWGGGMKNHLHIEIYKHGRLTDPEPLISLLLLRDKKQTIKELNHWDFLLK